MFFAQLYSVYEAQRCVCCISPLWQLLAALGSSFLLLRHVHMQTQHVCMEQDELHFFTGWTREKIKTHNPKHNTNIKTNRREEPSLHQRSYVMSSKGKRHWENPDPGPQEPHRNQNRNMSTFF